MFSKRENPVSKLLVSLATAVLLIGAGAAVSWEEPSDGGVVSGDSVELNISDSDGDTSGTYHFFFKNSSDLWEEIGSGTSDNGKFTVSDTDWNTNDAGSGDYTLNVTNATSGTIESATIDVTADNGAPTVDSFSPSDGGYTNSDPVDVSFSSSDGDSSIASDYIEVEDSDGNQKDNASDTTVEISDLDNGEDYTVNYEVQDEGGNWNNGSWTFTFDNSYEGDTSPDLPDEKYVLLGKDEDYDFDVELSEEDESSDITVECYDGDDDQIDSDTQSVSGDTTFTCEVDGDDYSGTETDIYVKMCDAAGNCKESDTETYYFDGEAPEVLSSDMPGSTVNSDFPVDYTASDDSSGIAKLEYFYSSNTDEGDGNEVNTTATDGEFTASISDLSEGDHTLYFRVKDKAGRWSDSESIDFEYDPDATPDISLDLPSNVSIKAGESEGFDVTLENTGDIFIDETNVSVSSGIFSGSDKVTDMEPGDTETVSFDVDTAKEDLGKYEVTVSMSYPQTSKSFTLFVKATSSQEDSLDSRLSKYESKLSLLEANWTQKKGGWGKDLQQRFESNFTVFRQKVEDAVEAKEEGDYYKVSSSLEGIDSDYAAAEKSLQNVQKIDSRRDTRLYIMIGLGLFVALLGGVGGFLYWSDEYEIDVDKLVDSDIDIKGVDDIVARIKTFTGGEEEAEEFEWDGFKDY